MAGTRGHYRDVIGTNRAGQFSILDGATVYVYKPGTTTQITNVYTGSTGATAYTQPLTTDINGLLEFYLAGEQDVALNISKTGYTTTTVTVTVDSPDTLVPSNSANAGFSVDQSTTSAATGILITSNIAGSGVAITTTSSGTNESVSLSAKGTGTITLSSPMTTVGPVNSDMMLQRTDIPLADTVLIDTAFQGVVYGTYTVNGTLTNNGRLTVAGFPT